MSRRTAWWLRSLVVALAVVGVPVALCGQDSPPLTKDQVIQMTKAGLPDDVIIAKVNAEPEPMNLSTDDLIALKTAGVSDNVIKAMIAPRAAAPAAAAPAPAPAPAAAAVPPPDENDPMSPHDPGIYLYSTTRDGARRMILIERAGAGHEKTANVWGHAFSYGIAKAKVKAELPGPHAAVRSTVPKPEFYMYFPPTGNLGSAESISSPSQFSMLALEEKKDHRETAVFKLGFASASGGTDEKKVRQFTAEKVKPYVYRVVPNGDLQAGEYAFVATTGMAAVGGSGASVVLYDFGVDLR